MAKIEQSEQGHIFAPTTEEIRASRERVRAIIREAKTRHHPFSREDFEALARTIRRPIDNEVSEKEYLEI